MINVVVKKIKFNSLHGAINTISILIIILSFAKGFYYINNYGNCDERARLIGARTIETNKDPYFYKWQTEDGAYLLDPNDQPNRIVNGVTSTPLLLQLIAPLNKLTYTKYKLLWGVICYMALCIIVLLTVGGLKKILLHINWLLPVVALFLSSSVWFIHLERGQIYICYTLLLALFYYCTIHKNKYVNTFAGFILALATFIRPTFIFLLLPILIFKNYKVLSSFAIGAIIIGVSQIKNLWVYKSYSLAMRYYTGQLNMDYSGYQQPTLPQYIEGINYITKIKADFYCGGIEPIFYHLQFLNIPHFAIISLFIITILLSGFVLFYKFAYKLQTLNNQQLGIILFLCYIIPEILMAAPRGAYNLVAYIFPIIVLFTNNIKIKTLHLLILITGWLFIQAIPFYFNINYALGETMLLFTIANSIFYSRKKYLTI